MCSFQEDIFIAEMLELIRQASTELPEDVEKALKLALKKEEENSVAQYVLEMISENIQRARKTSRPLCQDTGLPAFYISYNQSVSTRLIRSCVKKAVVQASEKAYLRPNAVSSISGKNSGNNLGSGIPYIEFEEWSKHGILVKCMLKGGGCENVSSQYAIPSPGLEADRDLDGVYTCVMDAVQKAQGKGCAPGILGIGIGGDRIISMQTAKKQLFRTLDDVNEDPLLVKLEERLLKDANKLGIGPMGLGGKTTVLAVKVGASHRIPASFFVSISYMCWVCRRKEMYYSLDGP
ncbi:MAG: fumarate hydratase [Candidatus Neomarinimicrobiota bacterium]